jgi:hypothetical protein
LDGLPAIASNLINAGDTTVSTSQSARVAIVAYSLGITGGLLMFLLLAQPLHMRFNYVNAENLKLIDVVLPTFLGYLGSASHFLFNANKGREIDESNAGLLKLLVHGPFILFIVCTAALFYTYYDTHLPLPDDAPRVDYLKFSDLSRYLSLLLGILAATVSVVSAYLFGSSPIAPKRRLSKQADINPV